LNESIKVAVDFSVTDDRAERQLQGAVTALRRYGRHDDGCPIHEAGEGSPGEGSPQPCECGLSDALAAYGGRGGR